MIACLANYCSPALLSWPRVGISLTTVYTLCCISLEKSSGLKHSVCWSNSIIAWPCHSLSCTFSLHTGMGLVWLSFQLISSRRRQMCGPITEESHRSRPSHHSLSLWRSRFSALIGCQSAVLSRSTRRAHETQIKL